jgi:acyl-coenzyme A synthetase/AMP-(fatty) acid ligase
VTGSRGEEVSSKAVETVLEDIGGAAETAASGFPEPVLDQSVMAFIVTEGKESRAAKVIAHCRARLEDFMVRRYVQFLSTFPRTSSGKISGRELE